MGVWTRENILGFLDRFDVQYGAVQDGLNIALSFNRLREMFEEVESSANAWSGALEEAVDEMAGPASNSIMERAVQIMNGEDE